MEYIRKHKRGLIGTLLFHIIVLVLLIFLGFFTPLPLPGEEGILVNFGDSENGLGDIEPSPAKSEPAPVKKEEKEVPPPPVKTSPPKQQTKPAAAKEAVMTQDYEKTAAVDAAENKKKTEEKKEKDRLVEQRRKQALEAERIKNAEAEKLRKEEAAQKAKEEAERKAREEQQRKANEIKSLAQGAFSSSGNGSGGKGTGEGKSQGVTFPGGNQGVPTGDPNSNNYGPGRRGSGNKGTGPSFSLSGRSAVSLPIPNYPGNDEGNVVVKITVDKNGKVTNAEPGVQGTTLMNQKFWEEAKQAALKAKFNADNNASAYQQGTITYRFVLN